MVLGWLVSNMMIKPGSAPVFGNPRDFELEYEDVSFNTRDGVTLRGWLLPGEKDRVVIQSHFGVQCSRSGYTPKGKGLMKQYEEIQFLRQAKHLVEKGYTVLMWDLRNHGESDLGVKPWVSWGPYEALDVIAAVDFITNHPTYNNAGIGLLSICMGGAASTYAYGLGEEGLSAFSTIRCMLIVQPLLYKDFVRAYGIPDFVSNMAAEVSKDRLDLDLRQKSFLPAVEDITVPTMVLQNKNDPWTNMEFVENYYRELKVEKELLLPELERNRFAAYNYLGSNPEVISTFLTKYM
mmetsp:Transcript_7538/g.11244  ORF Transcript_7538/g.11244 Transcript_7538/m.11244 type:complete len:293 (-) Transcript_7538:788-1666(-)|eukprot:CAMPEP_0184747806 /NCGR_PEP_ID=MMETSP0315-20130426/13731_1 /TAXON_ID=101924 /ORGANISM="Rhodosorus marinus, Strain UTEX LB 2760" /LENGTH=292 /DNA_ID=CAMNT_0027221687 /DNA_START=239 /DNA_END=1117 /DNA_ORIENTATION=-